MLQIYSIENGCFKALTGSDWRMSLAGAHWVDVHDASAEEQQALEQALQVELPEPQEPDAFQVSSPLRISDRQMTLTALLLTGIREHEPALMTVPSCAARVRSSP